MDDVQRLDPAWVTDSAAEDVNFSAGLFRLRPPATVFVSQARADTIALAVARFFANPNLLGNGRSSLEQEHGGSIDFGALKPCTRRTVSSSPFGAFPAGVPSFVQRAFSSHWAIPMCAPDGMVQLSVGVPDGPQGISIVNGDIVFPRSVTGGDFDEVGVPDRFPTGLPLTPESAVAEAYRLTRVRIDAVPVAFNQYDDHGVRSYPLCASWRLHFEHPVDVLDAATGAISQVSELYARHVPACFSPDIGFYVAPEGQPASITLRFPHDTISLAPNAPLDSAVFPLVGPTRFVRVAPKAGGPLKAPQSHNTSPMTVSNVGRHSISSSVTVIRRMLPVVVLAIACDRATGAAAGRPADRAAVAPAPVVVPASPSDTMPVAAAASNEDIPFVPADATDSLFLRSLPDRLDHLLFARWRSDTTDYDCGEDNPDGYVITALRGVARIRVLKLVALSPEQVKGSMRVPTTPDSTFHVPKRVDTKLELVSVISFEGFMSSMYDTTTQEAVVYVRPRIDTVLVSWARFTDSWHRCGDAWTASPSPDAISLIGPPHVADSLPHEHFRPLTPDATVARAMKLADSIARAGPAVDVRVLDSLRRAH